MNVVVSQIEVKEAIA
jgi:hypothetical protein